MNRDSTGTIQINRKVNQTYLNQIHFYDSYESEVNRVSVIRGLAHH